MKYRILGSVELAGGALTGARQRTLLALLLANAGAAVTGDRIAFELWGDEQPDDPAGAVRTQVSRLRRAGADIATRGGGYALEPEPGDLDADEFRARVANVRLDNPDHARRQLAEALALWRGPAFGDLADREFAQLAAVQLDELRLDTFENYAEVLLSAGAYDDAIRAAEEVAALAPVRERPRALLMRALYGAGRQVEALEAFHVYRTYLAEELGLEPSPELRALERDILDHRPAGAAGRRVAVPVTSFLGRDDTVATVDALLDRARLVTLIGPGGVGKTRLSLHVSAVRENKHRDGVVFCDLSPVTDATEVQRAVAAALAVTEQPGKSLSASITDAVSARDMLLVFDNCEHVVEPVAVLLETVLPFADTTRVLATSRERLAVDGEHVQGVPTLAVSGPDEPAAVRLFLDRARALDPAFSADREDIAHLCRRLDGLPLAIELAAALTPALSVQEILDGLDARFDLLTGGRRANTRHRSLEATVEWSYTMLNDTERAAFERCAVFSSAFTVADAQAVAGSNVAAVIARLVELSMVTRTADGRYVMLETLRDYGRSRLVELGLDEEVHRLHANHFVRMARQQDFVTLDAHFDDLRTAHRWLLGHDLGAALALDGSLHFYTLGWMRTEVSDWAAQAIALPDTANHDAFLDATATAAIGAWQQGDLDGAEALVRRGINSSHFCLAVMSDVALFRGELDDAHRYACQGEALAIETGDTTGELLCMVNQALARAYGGKYDEGIAHADALVAGADARGGPGERAMALYTAGECRMETDPDRALGLLEQSRVLAAAVGASFPLGIATVSAASLRARRGDIEGAIGLYAELVDYWGKGQAWPQQWITLRTLVELLHDAGEHEAATTLLAGVTLTAKTTPFGADAERMDRLATELRAALGDERFTTAHERGEALTAEGSVDFARRTLRSLREA